VHDIIIITSIICIYIIYTITFIQHIMSDIDWRVCQCMLLLNALWDLVSSITIWQSFGYNYDECTEVEQDWCKRIAEMHTGMWCKNTNATNYASCMLMAHLVLMHSMIRLYAAFHHESVILAIFSYGVEGFFFLIEACKGTMQPNKAYSVSLFSFICMIYCYMNLLWV
jgi:hypothetical protein